MPSLLCPLFRSKKKTKTAATDGKAASFASKSLVDAGMPGEREYVACLVGDGDCHMETHTHIHHCLHRFLFSGNTDGMSPDRSRSTMDTARLTVLSLETNRRGNFRDDDSRCVRLHDCVRKSLRKARLTFPSHPSASPPSIQTTTPPPTASPSPTPEEPSAPNPSPPPPPSDLPHDPPPPTSNQDSTTTHPTIPHPTAPHIPPSLLRDMHPRRRR